MRFKIYNVSSESAIGCEQSQLANIFQSTGLNVEIEDGLCSIQLGDGGKAYIAGSILGIKNEKNEMVPATANSSGVKSILQDSSLDKIKNSIEGRFVIILLKRDGSCLIIPDKYGKKDVYYQKIGNGVVFASDMSIMPVSKQVDNYNDNSLIHTLTVFGFRPPKRHTIYNGVSRLGVGESAIITPDRFKILSNEFIPVASAEYSNDKLKEYADLLIDAVKIRSSENGNIVYLSSGWDSSSILACLVHLYGPKKVRAATVRIQISERSGVMNEFEIKRAKQIADFFGVKLDIIDLDYRHKIPAILDKYLPLMKSHQVASLTCLSHGLLTDFVMQTSNGNESVFAGEISDGAHNLGFSQFATIFHPDLNFREYADKMNSYLFGPSFLKAMNKNTFQGDLIYKIIKGQSINDLFDSPEESRTGNKGIDLLASFFLRSKRIPYWSHKNAKILTEAGVNNYSAEMESGYLEPLKEIISPENLYSIYLHLYNSFHWQGSTVSTLSLFSEANGFHLGLPFWDSRIIDFLSAMPENWGRGLELKPTKYPLKWAVSNCMKYPNHLQIGPHSYQYDVDEAVTPAGELMNASAIGGRFKEILKKRDYQNVLSSKSFNLPYIDSIVTQYLEGTEIKGLEFNDLVSLSFASLTGWYGV